MAGSSKHKDSNRSSTKTRNAEEGSRRKKAKARDVEEVSQVQADPELAALSVPHDSEAINGAPMPVPSEQAYEEVEDGEVNGQADGAAEDNAGARDTDEDEFGDLMANTDRVTAYQGSTECSAGPRDSISIADSLPQMELSGTTDVCFKRVAGAIVSKEIAKASVYRPMTNTTTDAPRNVSFNVVDMPFAKVTATTPDGDQRTLAGLRRADFVAIRENTQYVYGADIDSTIQYSQEKYKTKASTTVVAIARKLNGDAVANPPADDVLANYEEHHNARLQATIAAASNPETLDRYLTDAQRAADPNDGALAMIGLVGADPSVCVQPPPHHHMYASPSDKFGTSTSSIEVDVSGNGETGGAVVESVKMNENQPKDEKKDPYRYGTISVAIPSREFGIGSNHVTRLEIATKAFACNAECAGYPSLLPVGSAQRPPTTFPGTLFCTYGTELNPNYRKLNLDAAVTSAVAMADWVVVHPMSIAGAAFGDPDARDGSVREDVVKDTHCQTAAAKAYNENFSVPALATRLSSANGGFLVQVHPNALVKSMGKLSECVTFTASKLGFDCETQGTLAAMICEHVANYSAETVKCAFETDAKFYSKPYTSDKLPAPGPERVRVMYSAVLSNVFERARVEGGKWIMRAALCAVIFANWRTFRDNSEPRLAGRAYLELYPFVKKDPDAAHTMPVSAGSGGSSSASTAQTNHLEQIMRLAMEKKRKRSV